MNFDAFTAGIEPGGLRTRNEIRILICYLLASIDAPLAKADLIDIIVQNGIANYFETADVSAKGVIRVSSDPEELCSPTDSARMISKQLDSDLPATVRHSAQNAAINLLAKAKRERENHVEISRAEKGYSVTCHISGGDTDLMSFSLTVPDSAQAKIVRENFQESPETVYRMLLALVTGEKDVAAGILHPKDKL
jgi:hypothetical protein